MTEGSRSAKPTFTLLPLDERPVNTTLPTGIAAIAGVELHLPPRPLLPVLRQAGNPDALGRWLERASESADAVIASVDMLCFGGLIASRTSQDRTLSALTRLDVLTRIKAAQPELPMSGISLVMRASDSYSAQEEPDYWTRYGRELHRLGALHHRDHLVQLGALNAEPDGALSSLRGQLPADILRDFERRRLRNHQINLAALELAAEGITNPLLITADDTAEFAAGSMEQLWLRQWSSILPRRGEVLMYPGADEVAAVLVARQLGAHFGVQARFTVECADIPGLQRIPNYENAPLMTAIERQVRASGSALVDDPTATALAIHAPDPRRRDLCGQIHEFDSDDRLEADRTTGLVEQLLESGREVALADLRYSNGGDPLLVESLHQRGCLMQISAYGGWNTAGNALGSTIAASAAIQVARVAGTLDQEAARKTLLHRICEDYAYQAVARRPLNAGLLTFESAKDESSAAGEVTRALTGLLRSLSGQADLCVEGLTFPWHRSFEIDFSLSGTNS